MEKNNKVVIWLHMHQPDYFDPISNIQYLPWVRRHALGGYYTVPKILESTESKININFSGVLLKQILDYKQNRIKDFYATLEEKPTDSLTASEVDFIIQHFLVPIEGLNTPRAKELFEKKKIREKFSKQDILDTQVLFALSAFSPLIEETKELKQKDRNFTESDKIFIKTIENKIISALLSIYKSLYEKGQIELTVTPFYHPILPLLIDTNTAKKSKTDTILPYERFQKTEDAVFQVKQAIEIFKRIFGKTPKGMWPAEGSVSNEAIDLIKESGIEWIGTDETILRNSKNISSDDSFIWNVRGLKVLFRDHALSDKIAFIYNKMTPEAAAEDFYKTVQNSNKTKIVILDGENPWEFYPNKGVDFLKNWFDRISSISILGNEAEASGEMQDVHPGSWINGFFDTWIGHKESNIAWDYLVNARTTTEGNTEALKEIYIAEGSDSFWWFSDFHKDEVDFSFDWLFRAHLIKAYQIAEKEVPTYLYYPIKEVK